VKTVKYQKDAHAQQDECAVLSRRPSPVGLVDHSQGIQEPSLVAKSTDTVPMLPVLRTTSTVKILPEESSSGQEY
jgi:hypothetical protein